MALTASNTMHFNGDTSKIVKLTPESHFILTLHVSSVWIIVIMMVSEAIRHILALSFFKSEQYGQIHIVSGLSGQVLTIALWANHLKGWCIFWNWPLSGLQGVEVCAGLLQSVPMGAAECVQGYRVCAGCSFNILPCSSRLNQKIFY